jgi:TP901 family phage tail tape measure protein
MITEAIEVLATIKGIDLVSEVLGKVSGSFAGMAETAQTAATAAEEAAARIDAGLLSTASGADAVRIADAQLSAARLELNAATKAQADAETDLIARQERAAASSESNAVIDGRVIAASDALTAAQKRTAAAADEMAAAESRLAATVDAASGANLAAARESAVAADEQAAASTKAGEASAESSTKAKNAAFIATAVVAGIGYESIKSAMSFQELTTRLVTTANASQSTLAQVRQGILQISNQTGVSAADLAKSMYIVEAAGFDAANGGIDVLRASTQGAALEGADFATVSNAVTDILKDYHKSGAQAANVTSQLTASVSVGKATFQTMSSAMGNVLPLAAAVGLKFNDVAGTLAEMTSHGVTAQRASQNLATAIRSLEKPTAMMQKEFKATGITTQELNQHLSTQGIGGTLQWLSQVAATEAPKLHQTYAGALGSLVGTAAGLNVALMTTDKNAGDTANAISTIGKATADANGNVKGFSNLQQTASFQLARAKQAVINVGIAIGTALLPLVTSLANGIARIIGPITQWIQKHQQLVIMMFKVVGGILLVFGAIKMVTTVIELLDGAMTLLTENPVVAVITLIVIALVLLYTHCQTARRIMNDIGSFLAGAFKAAWKLAGDVINWFTTNVMPTVKAVIKDVIDWFDAHKQDFIDAWNKLVNGVKDAVNWFNANVVEWVKARISDLTQWWSQHGQQMQEAWTVIWAVISTAIKIAWNTYIHPTLTIIMAVWTTVWGIIRDAFKLVWAIISGVITTVMHTIMNTISIVLDIITGKWGQAWQDVKKLVSQGLSDVWHLITSVFSGAGTLLWDAGVNIIKGLIGGIKSMFNNVTSAIGDITSAISSFLPHSPAKQGALSGSGSPELAGAKISTMVASGIRNSSGSVKTAASDTAQLAAKALAAGSASIGISGQFGVSGLGVAAGGLGAGGAGDLHIHVDLRGAQIMSDRDTDQLLQKMEKRLATLILPSGGYRSKF